MALRSEALRNSCKCTKLSSDIQICRRKKRRLRPGEATLLGTNEEWYIQESNDAADGGEMFFKSLNANDLMEIKPILQDIEYRIE